MFSCPILPTRPAYPRDDLAVFQDVLHVAYHRNLPIITVWPSTQPNITSRPTAAHGMQSWPRSSSGILETSWAPSRWLRGQHLPIITTGPPQCPSSLLDHHNAHYHYWTTTMPIITCGPPQCPSSLPDHHNAHHSYSTHHHEQASTCLSLPLCNHNSKAHPWYHHCWSTTMSDMMSGPSMGIITMVAHGDIITIGSPHCPSLLMDLHHI